MKLDSKISSSLLFLVGVAGLGLAITFLHSATSIINAFVLALIIVFTVSPVMYALKRKGAPSWLAFIATVLVVLVALLLFVLIVVGAGKQFMNTLPEYLAQAESSTASIESTFSTWGVENLGFDPRAMAEIFDPSKLLDMTGSFIAGIVDAFSDFILVGALILFMLVDAVSMPSKMLSYLDAENPFILRLRRYTALVRRYIGITTIVGVVTGALDTILFLAVGVDFALLWGIVAFLFTYIPTIGFWLAAIPPTIMAYLEFGFPTAILLFFGIVIINGFAGNIVQPKFMGVGLDLSFFTVFFSVILWSAILGSLGAILAIPMTLAFKVLVLEGDEGGRWFFDMISNKKKEPKLSEVSNKE